VLGGGEVSLLEMTSAYGVFANEGLRNPHTSIKEIYKGEQKENYTTGSEPQQVLESNVARSISDMLSDNAARTPAFGADSYLHFSDRDVAVKTGTTNDYRDAWIIGYTPDISVGAWAGNNNNSAMDKKVAGFIVAPMWSKFMDRYFELHPEKKEFAEPAPLDAELKPVLRGYKPSVSKPSTSSSSTDSLLGNQTETIHHSILHWVQKDNPRGPSPSNPYSDPQYAYWEYGVSLWLASQGSISIFDILKNEEEDTVIRPKVKIRKPGEGDVFDERDTIKVNLSITTEEEIDRIEFFVDAIEIGKIQGSNEDSFEFTPREEDIKKGSHTLLVVVYTDSGTRGGSSVEFEVD
jgi:membrane carboxypeptidase/penicillin-binding protein PbpC